MWEQFYLYEKLLWKIVWKWMAITSNRYDKEELFNELIVVYAGQFTSVRNGSSQSQWGANSERDFRKLLSMSCWNHMCDYVIRRNKKVVVSVEDVIVEANLNEFNELFSKFFVESLFDMVTSDHGREILRVLVREKETLEKASLERRSNRIRNRMLNKEDLRYYFIKERGWPWQDYVSGMKDVEHAFKMAMQESSR